MSGRQPVFVKQLGVFEPWEQEGTDGMNYSAEIIEKEGERFVVIQGLQGVQLPLSQDPSTVARHALALVLGGSPDAYDVQVTGTAAPARPRGKGTRS